MPCHPLEAIESTRQMQQFQAQIDWYCRYRHADRNKIWQISNQTRNSG
jgi:hypothetical protein